MNLYPPRNEQAITQETETLLRITLHEHAPQNIDLERGWTAVSHQMASLDSKSQSGGSLRKLAPATHQRLPGRRSWMLATAAALLLALLGAGFAAPFAHWFGGSTSAPVAYAAINQSMQIFNGVRLTATKGYVDPKHLVLYFDAQLSGDLKNKYTGPVVTRSTIQGKDAQITWATLAGATVNHGAIVASSGGDIAGKTFQVTWHISEIELISTVPGGAPQYIKGDWTFHFSIPFHHKVQEPLQLTFPGIRPIPVH